MRTPRPWSRPALVLVAALSLLPVARADEPGALRIRTSARTPVGDGPDQLERAPVFALAPDRATLDGDAVDPEKLQQTLEKLKGYYHLLHPESSYNGLFIVACAPETRTDMVAAYLRRALAAGSPNVLFAFLHQVPGTEWSTGTAVKTSTTLSKEAKAAAPTTDLILGAYRDCSSLADALLKARKQKRSPRLVLGEEQGQARRVH
jgi:hypothetical protein